MLKLTAGDALRRLAETKTDFARLIEKDSFDVSLYKPEKIDPQTPHARDELYVIASGSGKFLCDGETESVATGDVLLVAAGAQHRFENFTDDFSTWVIFLGNRPGKPAH
ncbi:MAG TPA: cupin domain-containing protein [Rhizomicrobium sp.]|nr:cupin domain-containing protein [Rhizomicrobium sp.]